MQMRNIIILLVLIVVVGALGWKACKEYQHYYPTPVVTPATDEGGAGAATGAGQAAGGGAAQPAPAK